MYIAFSIVAGNKKKAKVFIVPDPKIKIYYVS